MNQLLVPSFTKNTGYKQSKISFKSKVNSVFFKLMHNWHTITCTNLNFQFYMFWFILFTGVFTKWNNTWNIFFTSENSLMSFSSWFQFLFPKQGTLDCRLVLWIHRLCIYGLIQNVFVFVRDCVSMDLCRICLPLSGILILAK